MSYNQGRRDNEPNKDFAGTQSAGPIFVSEVMADNEILEDVLEIILGHPVPLKDKAQAEKELRRTPQNKSVYFDVYGEDIRDVAYDMEVQRKEYKGSAETDQIL